MKGLRTELHHLLRWAGRRQLSLSHSSLSAADRRRVLGAALAGATGSTPDSWRALEGVFAGLHPGHHAVALPSGRVALRAILEALPARGGSEVVLPAFTCVVVPFAIQHAGLRPRYVDICPDLMVDVQAVQNACTRNTSAILVQHTFGALQPTQQLVPWTRSRQIALIEDCAHVSPGRGTDVESTAAFYSFNGTKPVSGGEGGMARTANLALDERLRQWRNDHMTTAPARTVVGVAISAAVSGPRFSAVGRWINGGMQRAGLADASIPPSEQAGLPRVPPMMSNLQVELVQRQLRRIRDLDERRADAVDQLRHLVPTPLAAANGPLLRYPFFVADREAAIRHFSRFGIQLGTWFEAPLHPRTADAAAAGYERGSCPVAELAAAHCVNLPTLFDRDQLTRIQRALGGVKILEPSFASDAAS